MQRTIRQNSPLPLEVVYTLEKMNKVEEKAKEDVEEMMLEEKSFDV